MTRLALALALATLAAIPQAEQLCRPPWALAARLQSLGYAPQSAVNVYLRDSDEEPLWRFQEWRRGELRAWTRGDDAIACVVADGKI